MKLVLLALIALTLPLAANASEMSAAKKRYYTHGQHHPQYRASGPADPSFDRYGRPYRPTVQGPCMVDLGYGRFARCDGSL